MPFVQEYLKVYMEYIINDHEMSRRDQKHHKLSYIEQMFSSILIAQFMLRSQVTEQ